MEIAFPLSYCDYGFFVYVCVRVCVSLPPRLSLNVCVCRSPLVFFVCVSLVYHPPRLSLNEWVRDTRLFLCVGAVLLVLILQRLYLSQPLCV